MCLWKETNMIIWYTSLRFDTFRIRIVLKENCMLRKTIIATQTHQLLGGTTAINYEENCLLREFKV